MATSETAICNMALARIGAKRINNLDTDSSLEAVHCRTHYEQVRDALLRSHSWRFATARAELSQDATDPDFDWDHQYVLPSDFLKLVNVWGDTGVPGASTMESYALEGQRLLLNDDECNIVYIKRITDVAQFDPMFTNVLVLALAARLVMPLAQDKVALRDLQEEFRAELAHARTVNRQETNTRGREDRGTWFDARLGDDRIVSEL